jgi:hypothetical protein
VKDKSIPLKKEEKVPCHFLTIATKPDERKNRVVDHIHVVRVNTFAYKRLPVVVLDLFDAEDLHEDEIRE